MSASLNRVVLRLRERVRSRFLVRRRVAVLVDDRFAEGDPLLDERVVLGRLRHDAQDALKDHADELERGGVHLLASFVGVSDARKAIAVRVAAMIFFTSVAFGPSVFSSVRAASFMSHAFA